MICDKSTLKDLDDIEQGAGDLIQQNLDSVGSYSLFLEKEKEIKELLKKIGVDPEDVIVEAGLASGLTIAKALENAHSAYQFKDQFDG